MRGTKFVLNPSIWSYNFAFSTYLAIRGGRDRIVMKLLSIPLKHRKVQLYRCFHKAYISLFVHSNYYQGFYTFTESWKFAADSKFCFFSF